MNSEAIGKDEEDCVSLPTIYQAYPCTDSRSMHVFQPAENDDTYLARRVQLRSSKTKA